MRGGWGEWKGGRGVGEREGGREVGEREGWREGGRESGSMVHMYMCSDAVSPTLRKVDRNLMTSDGCFLINSCMKLV